VTALGGLHRGPLSRRPGTYYDQIEFLHSQNDALFGEYPAVVSGRLQQVSPRAVIGGIEFLQVANK
jgi:hypothetical protein